MTTLNETITAHSAALARPEHIAPLDARRRTEPRKTTMEECMGSCQQYIEVGSGEEAWCPACWREYQRFMKARGK